MVHPAESSFSGTNQIVCGFDSCMRRFVLTIFGLLFCLAGWASAQSVAPSVEASRSPSYLLLDGDSPASPPVQTDDHNPAVLIAPAPSLPRMSPELTLQAYRK